MPKINITEIDNTTAGSVDYQDYTVLIPGPASGRILTGNRLYTKRTAFLADILGEDEDIKLTIVSSKTIENVNVDDTYKYLYIETFAVTASGADYTFQLSSSSAATTYTIKTATNKVEWSGGSVDIENDQFTIPNVGGYVIHRTNNIIDGVLGYELNIAVNTAGTGYEWEAKNVSATKENDKIYEKVVGSVYYWTKSYTATTGIEEDLSFLIAKYLLNDSDEVGLTILYAVKPTPASTALTRAEWDTWFNTFRDQKYDIRFIQLGSCATVIAIQAAIACAADRGDCIAVADVIGDGINYNDLTNIEAKAKELIEDSDYGKYAALFVPAFISNAITGKYMPASFGYLKAFAQQLTNGYSEWFATAGATRGIIPLTNVTPRYAYGDSADDILQDRETAGNVSVNMIREIRPFGNIIWGNRTAYPITTDSNGDVGLKASNFLNIRQLLCTLKKLLYRVCRQLTFQPNSDILWIDFQNKIIPTLENMKSSQGIKGYKLVKEATDVKATLKAKLIIIPIEAVEDFELTIDLSDSISIEE